MLKAEYSTIQQQMAISISIASIPTNCHRCRNALQLLLRFFWVRQCSTCTLFQMQLQIYILQYIYLLVFASFRPLFDCDLVRHLCVCFFFVSVARLFNSTKYENSFIWRSFRARTKRKTLSRQFTLSAFDVVDDDDTQCVKAIVFFTLEIRKRKRIVNHAYVHIIDIVHTSQQRMFPFHSARSSYLPPTHRTTNIWYITIYKQN